MQQKSHYVIEIVYIAFMPVYIYFKIMEFLKAWIIFRLVTPLDKNKNCYSTKGIRALADVGLGEECSISPSALILDAIENKLITP